MINRFVYNSLPERSQLTHEETLSKNFYYKNEELRLNILDTAGQSEYTPALPSKYCIGKIYNEQERFSWVYSNFFH